MTTATPLSGTKRRLSRPDRQRQLLDTAWALIRSEGTAPLTLGRLAETAGVTKPVAYDHFGSRNGLLAALYEDFDVRQNAIIDAAMASAGPTAQERAAIVAQRYVECVLTQGREIPDVLAALSGSPELAAVKRRYQMAFMEKCRTFFAPFCRGSALSSAALWAMLGAADALSDAAVRGDISRDQAVAELTATLLAMIERSMTQD